MTTWKSLLARSATLASRLRQERGQALVEFAVVLPVLLLIVMGIIFFGRYESYSSQMTQLAEIGARDAAVNATVPTGYSTLAAYIQGQATGELAQGSPDVQKVSVTVDCNPASSSDTTCNSGENVEVCVQATVQFPFLPIKASTIEQQATMRVETTGTTTNSVIGPNPPPSC